MIRRMSGAVCAVWILGVSALLAQVEGEEP